MAEYMDVREKMLGILAPTSLDFEQAEYLADYLVKNGVTVQEWISIDERFPKPNVPVLVTYDYGWVFVVDRDVLNKNGEWCYLDRNCKVTHWMPMPEPPKGE